MIAIAKKSRNGAKRTKAFSASRDGKGTKEWSEESYNICSGCEHQCRYCYAWTDDNRFGEKRRNADDWSRQVIKEGTRLGADIGNRGVVMFPTSHDITPEFLPQSLETIRNLLAAGNQVLVVSKPHLEVVKTLCKELADAKDNIMFRFTIGSLNESTCSFWEPGAPAPQERLRALRHVFEAGFATSVSMEPMLEDIEGTRAVIEAVDRFVTDTIWLGKMNRMPRERNKEVPGFQEAAKKIDAQRKDDKILALVDAFAAHPKVRWKDSVKEVLKKHGRPIPHETLTPEVLPPPALTVEETGELERLEAAVDRGVEAAFEMWAALHRIRTYRDGLLYRSRGFETFEAYCRARWDYAKAHAHRLANCGEFVETLRDFRSPAGDSLPMPRSEWQIRAVLGLPKERRVEAWAHVLEVAPVDVLTGPDVEAAVNEFSGKKAPKRLTPRARALRVLATLRTAVRGLPGAAEIGQRLDDVEGLIRGEGR